MNNFEICIKLPKMQHFLSTSEALGMKTVHLQELITNFKVVYNVISDNFYFDQNTAKSNLKKMCKI